MLPVSPSQPDSSSPTANPKRTATPGSPSSAQVERDAVSRRQSTRSRRARRRLLVAGSVLALGAVAGTGFTVSNIATADAAAREAQQLNASSSRSADHLGLYTGLVDAHAKKEARATIDAANATLANADGKVDASPLAASVASLQGFELLTFDDVTSRTKQTQAEIDAVQAAVAAHEQAAAAAAQLAANNTPEGARALARDMAASKYGWGDAQFAALEKLWQKESGWSYTAYNASSGATGIPQSLPGSKMATAGADWETNAATQIAWGLDYIARAYGSPASAWSHSQAMNWY